MDGLDIIVWVVAVAVGVVGEVFTASFFLIFFAFGAAVALLLALMGVGLPLQIVGFIGASVASMVILRPAVLRRLHAGGELYEGRGSIVGKRGVMTTAIEPGGSGTVRVGSGEFWTARAMYSGDEIGKGAKVRVLDTDGLTALVEPVENGGEEL